jgi:hypothetical protein
MNSQTLKENGFAEFFPLKELSVLKLPNNSGQVIVLIDKTLSGKPQSDIIYIGRTKKPVKKIFGGYIGGSFGGKAVKSVHNALFNDGYIEKTSIGWMSSDDPKKAQKELLEKFRSEHGEYPLWNAPKKKTEKPKSKQKSVRTQRTRKPAARKPEGPQ